MKFIKNLFKTQSEDAQPNLQKENEELKNALKECSDKLQEKQKHIDATNAYWKKRYYNIKKSKGL